MLGCRIDQPVLHDCITNDVVCAILSVRRCIQNTLLLIKKSSSCSGGSGFPLSLFRWYFTILYPTPNNRNIKCVECVVNKIFLSFLPLSMGFDLV